MKVLEKSEKRNNVLKRTEYRYAIRHSNGKTPSRAELQKFVSEELKIEPERVDIRKVYSRKGMPVSDALVFVWDEPKVKDLNKQESQKGKSEEGASAEKPEEKPAESKQE